MRKHNAMLTPLVVVMLIAIACSIVLLASTAHAEDPLPPELKASHYRGALTEIEASLKSEGFEKLGGYSIKNGDADHPFETSSDVGMGIWCILDASKRPVLEKRCVYGIQSIVKRDDKGKAIFKMEDALDFFPTAGFEFLDADTECASKTHPYRSVVAIGRWKVRKPPKVGGYAYAIKQAWLIDPNSKKFIEISTKDVSCEINEDRD